MSEIDTSILPAQRLVSVCSTDTGIRNRQAPKFDLDIGFYHSKSLCSLIDGGKTLAPCKTVFIWPRGLLDAATAYCPSILSPPVVVVPTAASRAATDYQKWQP